MSRHKQNNQYKLLIAPNIDTLFVVCSMNNDFNLNRIGRYLALANEAGLGQVCSVTLSEYNASGIPGAFCYRDGYHRYSIRLIPVSSQSYRTAVTGEAVFA